MAIVLPNLPYAINALEPHMSRETLEYHYGKHHQKYVDTLNKLVANTPKESMPLEEIIISEKSGAIFNNAAQVWNHSFFWNCLSPEGGGIPKGDIMDAIKDTFGSYDEFKKQFTQKAVSTFGSGWVWLVKNAKGSLEIISTQNADTPLTMELTPLLTCDVWEHAYYIDFRNSRPKYLEAYWSLVNWDYVEKNFKE